MYLLVLAPSEVPARGQDGGIRRGWCRQQGAQGLLWGRRGALWGGGAGEALGAQWGLCWGCAVLWGCSHMSSLGSSPRRAQGSAGAGAQAPPALCPCPNTGLLGLLGPHPASILTTPAPGKEPTAAPCLRQKVVHSPWAALGWPRPQSAPPHRCSPPIPSPFLLGLGSCSPSDPKGTFVPHH